MKAEEKRGEATSESKGSLVADAALIATLVGVVLILVVSMVNRRDLMRLNARVTQLETLAKAPGAQSGVVDRVYQVDVASAPAKGPATAPVTIAAFSEFECPFCSRVEPTLKQLEHAYKDKIRIAWKHLPLTGTHAHAMDAAVAAEAARRQGKFWEYHDKLFANQKELELSDLRRYAREIGLDAATFDKDCQDPSLKEKVLADMAEATSLSVHSTPTFFINGRLVKGAMPFETFAAIIDEELTKENASRSANAASN